MTLSHQKPPNPVRTSVEGTVDVSGAFTIGGVIDVSANGGVINVSANPSMSSGARTTFGSDKT